MSNAELQFTLPEEWSRDTLNAHLGQTHRVLEEPDLVISRTIYDSFDWRLYQAGGTLEVVESDRDRHLVWRGLGDGERSRVPLADGVPLFARDLPDGVLRERLASLLEMRALLPQAQVDSRVQTLRVLNEDDKTVLRLVFERATSRDPTGGSNRALGARLRLAPVRGYDRVLQRVQGILSRDLGLTPAPQDLALEALTSVGRTPGGYSSKLKFNLQPETRSDAVAKHILLHLLDTLETNVAGARADLDPEFLHDLRVAVRRSRSALSQIKGVFAPDLVERYKSQFGWIGQITGPTRDMDVYLLAFAGYRERLPERFRVDLEPLHRFLQAHQSSEQRALANKLGSPHFRKILKEWRSFLEQPVPAQPTAPNAARPIQELADERIYKAFKRVLKEGAAIGPESPAEQMHELRKSCKKLRYLMEFFASLYPAKQVRPVIKALKRLLDNLGNFQDLEVQADKLRGFAHQMVEEGQVPADTLLAMGMLVDGLLQRQQQAGAEFSKRFARFAAADNRRAVKSLCSGRTAST
jgi:CHAD domain-containing protein